jgi:hypothetical protein
MAVHPIASACRSCRYYTPEGRRGGHCQQLGASVRGGWQACSLAIPAFAPSGENLAAVPMLGQILREALPRENTRENLAIAHAHSEIVPHSEKQAVTATTA